MLSWNDVLTLTRLEVAELNLLLLVCELGGILTKQDVQPSFVSSIGNDDQDWEEKKSEDGLPHLNQVFGNKYEDHQEPDVGQDRGQGGDAEDRELLDSESKVLGDKENKALKALTFWFLHLEFLRCRQQRWQAS